MTMVAGICLEMQVRISGSFLLSLLYFAQFIDYWKGF